EEVLTEFQLSSVRPETAVLDSKSAAVVQLLRDAGINVPTELTVPDSYATIYLSGNLDITHFPIFFHYGFHDVKHRVNRYFMPIQAASLNIDAPMDNIVVDCDISTPELCQWLEDHGFMDLAHTDALPADTNTAATGWHIFTLHLIKGLVVNDLFQGGMISGPALAKFSEVFASRATDGCRCACSSTGCLPMTTALKAGSQMSWTSFRRGLMNIGFGDSLWEFVQGETAEELLRFLTFEALEMTHTCCKEVEGTPTGGPACLAFLMSKGDIEDIHEEEKALHLRLEELLLEFSTRLESSGEGLKKFVLGYWRERMAEECVPARFENEALGVESGVIFENNCKSTYARELITRSSRIFKTEPQGDLGQFWGPAWTSFAINRLPMINLAWRKNNVLVRAASTSRFPIGPTIIPSR
ncbi:hypothetical protein IMZ48_37040, partial [Candidatus Bathyarchaeota archaeon]|nr:hypothetical protein [Candidatus Bathyarchaeota archaeon]